MTDAPFIPLTDRTLLRLTGADTKPFLQGIVTNNIETMREGDARFTCLLTPQGKWLHEFFLYDCGDEGLLLDVHHSHVETLMATLKKYKLRSKVQWEVAEDLAVAATFDNAPLDDITFCAADPRHAEMGLRIVASASVKTDGSVAEYHSHRIGLGIPDGVYDANERSLPIELGYDLLNGIDFTKGCYVGQEVTARMHYRKVRRRVPVVASITRASAAHANADHAVALCAEQNKKSADVQSHALGSNTDRTTALSLNEKEVGWLGAPMGNMAIAIIKAEALIDGSATLSTAADVTVSCTAPSWMRDALDEAAAAAS